MSNLEHKNPISIKVIYIFIFSFLMLVYSCKKSESNNNYNINNLENNSTTEYSNNDSINQEPTYQGQKLDDLFEVYHYIYSKGNVIEAETNVLFVDGKNDELQITIDMPDGKTYEYNLTDKVSLGVIKGLDSYLYNSDENDKINVFFKNGREMMGMAAGKEDFVFMNTPDYKD